MSACVAAAKPVAKQIISGGLINISPKEQESLATWIAIMHSMAEYIDTESLVVSASERSQIMATKLPPNSFVIHIGRYSGVGWRPMDYRHTALTEAIPPPLPGPSALRLTDNKIGIATGVIGSLAFHVASSTHAPFLSRFNNACLPSNMERIWPLRNRPIDWGTVAVLSDLDLGGIHGRFADLTRS
jgi:hypothetical protein